MPAKSKLAEGKERIFLFAIPALYFAIGGYFRYILGDLSLRSLDPDYIYFITGLGISEGHLNVAHVDNPGTPLQYLMGIVFRITHLFRPDQGTYLEDIFRNPDLYMAVSNFALIGLMVAFLFYSGRRVYQTTGSILYAILIQTTPFLPVIWYDLIGRIVPELLMPLPVLLLQIFIIELLYDKKDFEDRKQIIWLAAISAIGLSVKLTYIPLWFIPLIIIKSWKKKALFLVLSVVFFLAFAIPVTLRLSVFTGWIKSLFIHSGQYGGGDSNFVNWTEFGGNLKFLWGYERWFLIAFILTAVVLLIYITLKRRSMDKKLVWTTVAVLVAVLLQTGMVCKHFAHRYYIPALLLFPILVFLIAENVKRLLTGKTKHIVSAGLVVFIGAFLVHQQSWIKLKAEVMGNDMDQRKETWHFVSTLNPNSIRIITTQNYGSPFKEYALMVSYAWAGGQQKYFTEALAKIYPDSYLFFTWDNTFRCWGEQLTTQKLTLSGKPIYIYLENDSPELMQKTLEKLPFKSDSIPAKTNMLYRNERTKEVVYQLEFQSITNSAEVSR